MKRTDKQERSKWVKITTEESSFENDSRQCECGKKNTGEKWARDMRAWKMSYFQAESRFVCVYACVCVFPSPSKCVELVISPQQKEMWEQVQFFFPCWLRGNSSHLLCLRLSRSRTVQRTTSPCVLLISSIVCQSRTCFPPPHFSWPDMTVFEAAVI